PKKGSLEPVISSIPSELLCCYITKIMATNAAKNMATMAIVVSTTYAVYSDVPNAAKIFNMA
ncbi:MAG: hypothetical protein K2N14_05075, partial [Clostridia bacterium]|nr:hypothetical protein [Clostridia bacterium]